MSGSNVSLRMCLGNIAMQPATSGIEGVSGREIIRHALNLFKKSRILLRTYALRISLTILGGSQAPDPLLIKNACS